MCNSYKSVFLGGSGLEIVTYEIISTIIFRKVVGFSASGGGGGAKPNEDFRPPRPPRFAPQENISSYATAKTYNHTQAFPSCWTTVVEQPSVQPATVRPYPSSVPPGVKDVFVWLTETPGPSDLFLVCYTNALTYLLANKKVTLDLFSHKTLGQKSLQAYFIAHEPMQKGREKYERRYCGRLSIHNFLTAYILPVHPDHSVEFLWRVVWRAVRSKSDIDTAGNSGHIAY